MQPTLRLLLRLALLLGLLAALGPRGALGIEAVALQEGEVVQFALDEESIALYKIRNNNNIGNGYAYVWESSTSTFVYLCQAIPDDDDCITEETCVPEQNCFYSNKRMSLIAESKTTIQTNKYSEFVWGVGDYYVFVSGKSGATGQFQIFTTPELIDGFKTEENLENYDWDTNDNYRFYHGYYCKDSHNFIRFQANGGSTFGSKAGILPVEGASDLICNSSSEDTNNICSNESSDLSKGFYQYSFKKGDTISSYQYLYNTMEPINMPTDFYFSNTVSVYEFCTMIYNVDISCIATGTEFYIIAWSQDYETATKINITIAEDVISDSNAPISGTDYHSYTKKEGVDRLTLSIATSSPEWYFKRPSLEAFDFGAIVSPNVKPIAKDDVMYIIKGSNIQSQLQNSFILLTNIIGKPFSFDNLMSPDYDIIYFAYILGSGTATEYNISAKADFDKYSSSGKDYKNISTPVEEFNDIKLKDKGSFYTQGKILEDSFGYRNPSPILTVVNESETPLDDNLDVYVGIEPSFRLETDVTYIAKANVKRPLFIQFELSDGYTRLEITDNTSVGDEKKYITVNCSQKIYAPIDPDVVTYNNKLSLKQNFITFKGADLNEIMYCSLYYEDESGSSSFASVEIRVHDNDKYYEIYEGTPYADFISNNSTDGNQVSVSRFKILADSISDQGSQYNPLANTYDLLFVKLELISSGPIENDTENRISSNNVKDIDSTDKLIFCLSDTYEVNSCPDTTTDENPTDSNYVDATTPVQIIETNVSYKNSFNVSDGYLPSSTYIIIDPKNLAVGHQAEYILTVGYTVVTDYEELMQYSMNQKLLIYFNNDNKNTTDMHVQFVRVHLAQEGSNSINHLIQFTYNINRGSTNSDIVAGNGAKINGVLCPGYPMLTEPNDDTDIHCISTELGADDSNATGYLEAGTLIGSTTAAANVQTWYLTLVPINFNSAYIPYSEVHVQFEYILLSGKRTTGTINSYSTKVPYAIPINSSIRLMISLLSVTIYTSDVPSTYICFSPSTPQELDSKECIVDATKRGDGNMEIDIEFEEEWLLNLLNTPNQYTNTSYMYMTLQGQTSSTAQANNVSAEYLFKRGNAVNDFTELKIIANSDDGKTVYSQDSKFYYLKFDNDMISNLSKLVFVVIPPTLAENDKSKPNFYEDTSMKFTIYPGSASNSSEYLYQISKVEKGLIAYKLGSELTRIGVTDISNGFTVVLSPQYENYTLAAGNSVSYSVQTGLFYEDNDKFRAITLYQIQADSHMSFYTPGKTHSPDAILSNSFRIPPIVETESIKSDYTGALLMPCKGLPTVYESYTSESNTAFPSSDAYDKVVRYASDSSYNRGSLIKLDADKDVNHYATIEIERDSLINEDSRYGYYIFGNHEAICLPYVDGSTELTLYPPIMLDGKPFITLGFTTASAPDKCSDSLGRLATIEYTIYHYEIESGDNYVDVSDIPAYEIMPTSCGMLYYGEPSIVDDDGNPVWVEIDANAASWNLTTNAYFELHDYNNPDKEAQYVFNVLARVKDNSETQYINMSYDSVLVKTSTFDSIQDGYEATTYEGITKDKTVYLSPLVLASEDKEKFYYYYKRFYAQIETSKLTGISSVDSIACINIGNQKCLSDTTSTMREEYTAVAGTTQSFVFQLDENKDGNGIDSIVHYSLSYSPKGLTANQSVDLQIFGVSLIDLYTLDYLSTVSESFTPTQYFKKISDDLETESSSIDIGYIDLTLAENGSVTSLPNLQLTVSYDPKYMDNANCINKSESKYGIYIALCSETIEPDPNSYMNKGTDIGDTCVYLTELSSSISDTNVKSVIIDIPFGYNSAIKTNEVYINDTKKIFNTGTSFNIQQEGHYYLTMVTHGILPNFVWSVTTQVGFPIDITVASDLHRHETIIRTPRVAQGQNIFVTVYNTNTVDESSEDICGLYIYPAYRTTTSYSTTVCASSTREYPTNSQNECDISYSMVSDVYTYVSFPCKNANKENGQTYFSITMSSILSKNSAFVIEVIRSEKLTVERLSVSITLDQLFSIVKKDGDYYCGYNPLEKLDTSKKIDAIPVDCILKYTYYYDITSEVESSSFDSFTVSLEPPMTSDNVYHTDYSTDDDKDHIEGVFYIYGSGSRMILNSSWLPKDAKNLHTKGLQAISFYDDDIIKNADTDKKYVSFGIQINNIKIGDFIQFYETHKTDSLEFSVATVTTNDGETGVVSLDGDGIEDTSVVYISEVNEPNKPMYYSMYMTSSGKTIEKTELIISPCLGNPVVYASPYLLHPTKEEGGYEVKLESNYGREISFSLNSNIDESQDNTVWGINIDAPDENKYELYPNNSHYRPVQVLDYIEVKELTEAESSDKDAKFAVEFGYFDIAKYVDDDTRKSAEIRYYLYGYEDPEANYQTACSCIYNGSSLYVNKNTNTNYMVRSKNGETILRILANNPYIDMSEIQKVQIIAMYTTEDGTEWKSFSNSISSGSEGGSDGLPGWAIALIVIGVLLVLAGAGVIVYMFVFRSKHKPQLYYGYNDQLAAGINNHDAEFYR